MEQNQFMQKLLKSYPNYVELLTENDYVLALPHNQILQNCSIDEIFILEHILQASFDGKEFSSLNGKNYDIKDKRLTLISNPKVEAEILQTDVCYTDNQGAKQFKRLIISNSLDQRFFVQQRAGVNKQVNEGENDQMAMGKALRDPFEIVQFFKQKVFFEMESSYEDFLEEIKCLKENHILMKGHERAQSKTFKKIAESLKKSLLKTQSVQDQFNGLQDSAKSDALDNLVETLIYERIGAYMRKSLINLYQDEEKKFNDRVKSLYKLYKGNLKKFNEIFGSEFRHDVLPGKSLQIFKVFFRCQIPFEMFFTLHETILMASEEVSLHLGKPKGTLDAQTLTSYIIVIILHAREQLEKEDKAFNFKVRLLMMEHFTVHVLGMSEETYSFVTFKEAEKCIEECDL